ncbi:ParB/RepB/Spo0J family partition protein [Paraburkholderia aspalathi]|uniref:ParB/RepB/Spo0J family partition protein n=1 Tax=Paraburkholderia aspalathi TaxID=1324617 RepID=UPI001B016BEA|nr:ParB N-terminal domain-containing protein [Paraburkholderia aspalathi]CAE6846871.1 Nucleoid occlusion protein [Paraburkholderia aspalathi]
MGIADHLRKTVGNVKADEAPSAPAAEKRPGPKTAVGENMIYAGHLHSAQKRIKELENQLASAAAFEVDLESLVEVPGRRRKLTPEQFLELKSNLAKHPLATAIVVRRLPNGTHEIVAGHNRVTVYRELGRKTIRANVIEVQEGEVEFAAFFSNLLSPSLSDFEKFWNFKRLQEGTSLTRHEIATSAGLSEGHVSRIFAFEALPPEAQDILAGRPHRLGNNAAQKLATAAQQGKSAEVIAAVRRLVEDDEFTQEQAVASVSEKARKPPPAETIRVKQGKTIICEITTRNGIVGVRFAKDEQVRAADWAIEIQRLIETKMKERG